jgi:hypothetical protein
MEKNVAFRQDFLHENGEKCGLSDRIFSMQNGKKIGENGGKSGV